MNPEEFDSLPTAKPTTKPARNGQQPQLYRLPPSDVQAELGVLSCILQDPDKSLPVCIEKMKDGPVEFYDLRNQTIYGAMLELYDGREAIDVITLQSFLKPRDMLDQVGGIAFLASLPDITPSPANLPSYIEAVREKWMRRQMIATCTEAVAECWESTDNIEELMDRVEARVLRMGESRVTVDMRTMRELIRIAIASIESKYNKSGMVTGIATPYQDFNSFTGGLKGGQMIVVAARPSMGKTSFIMNVAEYVAVDLALPVGVFSLEMTSEELSERLLLSRSRVSLRNVREGFLAERDFPKITNASAKLAAAPMYIDDSSSLSILQLRAKARRMVQQYGIKMVCVDYLQLLNALGGGRKFESRRLELTDVSHGIKALAKELKIPVVVAAQLNRDVEREMRKPRMSDLQECGAIEQDADIISFLYSPLDKEEQETQTDGWDARVNLLIGKQRNGPAGVDVQLVFRKNYCRFESMSKVSETDIPQDYQQRGLDYGAE